MRRSNEESGVERIDDLRWRIPRPGAVRIEVRAPSMATVAQQLPEAFSSKDGQDVMHRADIGRKGVRLRPLGVLKG